MIVTDCDYVATGLRAVARGRAAAFVGGPDGVLWALSSEAVPAVRWVRSHQPAPKSEAVAYAEWEGNEQADRAARAKAAERAVAPAVISARKAAIERLRRAHNSIADVVISALRVAEAIGHRGKRKCRRLVLPLATT